MGTPAADILSRAAVLLPIGAHRARGRADERDARALARLGERGVLAEEAVAGVDGVAAGLLRDVDDLVDAQVALAPPARGRWGRPRRRCARGARRGRRRSRRRRRAMPISRSVRVTRTAISPRLAMRTLRKVRGIFEGAGLQRPPLRVNRGRAPGETGSTARATPSDEQPTDFMGEPPGRQGRDLPFVAERMRRVDETRPSIAHPGGGVPYPTPSIAHRRGGVPYPTPSIAHRGGWRALPNPFHRAPGGWRALSNPFHRASRGWRALSNPFHRASQGWRALPNPFHRTPRGWRALPNPFHRAREGFHPPRRGFHRR